MHSSPAEAEVLRIERLWAEAALKGDAAALSSIFSDDLKYVHATGVVETKQALVAAIESRTAVYQSIDSTDVAVRVVGDVAIVTSKTRIHVKIGGRDIQVEALFLRVYLKENDIWRLSYHQGTRLP